MRKVFQCNNSIELESYKDVLRRNDIRFLVKNEFISGAVGELPFTEAWPQIWVLDEEDEQRAKKLCQKAEQEYLKPQQDWVCSNCGETNSASFEFCWHCQQLAVNN